MKKEYEVPDVEIIAMEYKESLMDGYTSGGTDIPDVPPMPEGN